MEKKINITELLKDCPTGMELDCTTWENVTFEKVMDNKIFVRRNNKQPKFDNIVVLNEYGCVTNNKDEKCRIFPKGKTTWEGFVSPCQFKTGDVLVSEVGNIVLFSHIDSKNSVYYHCIIPAYCGSFRIEENTATGVGKYYNCVLANEQQRQRMYDKIKSSGYKYNQNTNKLEKLIEPKFKVGDRVKSKTNKYRYMIGDVREDCYIMYYENDKFGYHVPFCNENEFDLVPDKFDISKLKPFDKVLVRDSDKKYWSINFFGFYNEITEQFHCLGNTEIGWDECIPYEVNKELLGTTNDCDDFYKIWEK